VVRNAMTLLTAAWHSVLTQPQRNQWDLYAANVPVLDVLGRTIYLTGFNHYVRSNIPRIQIPQARVDDGPATLSLPDPIHSLTCSASKATQILSFTFDNAETWANENGAYLIVWQGKPRLATKNFFNGPWRYTHSIAGSAAVPPVSPSTANSQWTFQVAQVMTMYARITRADGRLGDPFRLSCTAVA
jgi:hypothetical protein